ncbi:hypothetical protein BGZ83_010065 [Gryganskiella cystojenkinii]|nr:hypothetical protein BGZ83_010065 [Gryganskiella cystojenkinii]
MPIRVWDLKTGQCLCTLSGHTEVFVGLIFLPDSHQVITSSRNRAVHQFEAKTGVRVHSFEVLPDQAMVDAIACSYDGELLASSYEDHSLRIWNIKTTECLHVLTGQASFTFCITFSPKGERLSMISQEGIKTWESKTGNELWTVEKSLYMKEAVAVSADGRLFACGTKENTVILCDADTGKTSLTLIGHTGTISRVVFSRDGTQLCTTSRDQTVRLWSSTGSSGPVFGGYTGSGAMFSPSGTQIASNGEGILRLYDNTQLSGTNMRPRQSHRRPAWVNFVPGERGIFISHCSDWIKEWDLGSGKLVRSVTDDECSFNQVAFSSCDSLVVAMGRQNTARLWDLETGQNQIGFDIDHHESCDHTLTLSDGNRLATTGGANSSEIRVWDRRTGTLEHRLTGHSAEVRSLLFSPNGGLQLCSCSSGTGDQTIRLWEMSTGQCIATMEVPGRVVSFKIVYSQDGSQLHTALVYASSDLNAIHTWDTTTGTSIRVFNTGCATHLDFTPDGQFFVAHSGISWKPTGQNEGTLQVWDMTRGERVWTLGKTEGWMTVAMSPDTQFLVSSNRVDGVIRLWDFRTGLEIARTESYRGGYNSLALDKATIVEGGEEGGTTSLSMAAGTEEGDVMVWKLVRSNGIAGKTNEGTHYKFVLQWTTAYGKLNAAGAKIEGVQGLSRVNVSLLKQNGACGEAVTPLRLDQAVTKIMNAKNFLARLETTRRDATKGDPVPVAIALDNLDFSSLHNNRNDTLLKTTKRHLQPCSPGTTIHMLFVSLNNVNLALGARTIPSPSPARPLGKLGKRHPPEDAMSSLVHMEDTIRIQFHAFNTTFHLHLEPNLDLIHPEADLGLHSDGRRVEREEIKAFKGVVVENEHHSNRKWDRASRTSRAEKRSIEHMLYEDGVLGWARMMVEHDPEHDDALILRGAFMVDGDTFHINTGTSYHIQKRSDDAIPRTSSSSPSTGTELIIYRDSDLYRPNVASTRKRALAHNNQQQDEQESSSSCGTDMLLTRSNGNGQSASRAFQTEDDYYHPPNLTTTIRETNGGLDLSSSWTDLLQNGRSSIQKRGIALKVAGPNPVPAGCPANRLVNYMGVAADCTYVRAYKSATEARKQIFADFNTASGIYESTFNVALGVISLNIVPDGCPTTPDKKLAWNRDCSPSYAIDQRLSDFSYWRGQDGRTNDGAGLWHLMTKCNSGPVVGIAWTKALCQMKALSQTTQGQNQYTAGTGVSSITPNEWMVVAHEVGHGFGAIHDCNSQLCASPQALSSGQCCPLSTSTCDAGAQYIMNPSETQTTKLFSPCSIKAICSTIKSSSGQCLKPPGTRSTQNSESNICGNGLKETGEECDCGSAEDCAKDPCCDGATCKLKNGAVCDDLNDDCCQNCKMKPQGQVCRQPISECDIQEVCTGTSATCPPDQRLPNQTPCKGTGPALSGGNSTSSGLECANGFCTSRDLQCQQQDRTGINKQCGASSSCDLTCNDPNGSPLSCMQIPGVFFLDGTSCGFGGSCNQGTCEYASGATGVLNWAKNHLLIVIPVASIVALLLLCCIWSCCCSGCVARRRHHQHQGKPTRLGSNGYQFAGSTPQQYPMNPLSAPPPAYQDGQPNRRSTGSLYGGQSSNNNHGGGTFLHSNESQSSYNNPFADRHAQPYQHSPSRQNQPLQHQSPSGYI